MKIKIMVLMSIFLALLFHSVEAREPFVLVELYTSEGCSSCPPADQFLRELTAQAKADNQRIFTLSFHVDYWNYLGWKDPYSQKQFTDRQRYYAKVLKQRNIYTPQMIINGRHGFGGYQRDQAKGWIDLYLQQTAVDSIDLMLDNLSEDAVSVLYELEGEMSGKVLRIALVEGVLSQNVTRGENRGQILSHDHVVRDFIDVDPSVAKGKASIVLPKDINTNQASVIAFLQNKNNFVVTAAEMVEL